MEQALQNTLQLDDNQKQDVRRLAALGYRDSQMPALLGLDIRQSEEFICLAGKPGTEVAELIREGLLTTQAAPEVKLHELAESGDIDAIKELVTIQRRHKFDRIIEAMDDDEI